jgi:hypothetical protein
MNYIPQIRMSIDDQDIVLYQGNAWCSKSIPMEDAVILVNHYEDADFDLTDFLIDTAGFEFITDYRVYLRTYIRKLGRSIIGLSTDVCCTEDNIYQVYIIDGDHLSKVKTPTGKVLVKVFRRLDEV